MAGTDLYGEAGSLMRSAGTTASEGGQVSLGIANMDEKAREFKTEQLNQIFQETMQRSAQEKQAKLAQAGETQRTGMQQAGETQREEMRQFVTMTPDMIKGLSTADPEGGWGKMTPGSKIDIKPFMGLYTTRMKMANKSEVIKDVKDTNDKGEPIFKTIVRHADGTMEIIAQGARPMGGKDGAGGSGKPPTVKDLQAQYEKTAKDVQDSLNKYGTGEASVTEVLRKIKSGSEVSDYNLSALRSKAANMVSLNSQLKGMGVSIPIDPLIQDLAAKEKYKPGDEKNIKGIVYVRGADGKWRPKN